MEFEANMGIQTFIQISRLTTSVTTGSITFSSIPQQYRDLVLVSQLRTTIGSNNESIIVKLNNDATNANYVGVRMLGSGSSTASDTVSGGGGGFDAGYMPASSSTSGVFGQINLSFMDYSSGDKNKIMLNRWNSAGSNVPYTAAILNRWVSNSPITTLSIYPGSGGSIAANSTFTLYGIAG